MEWAARVANSLCRQQHRQKSFQHDTNRNSNASDELKITDEKSQ